MIRDESMRAAVLLSPGRIEVRDRPVPEPGPGELLVRVRYAGVCGTDLALYDGLYETALPLVPGHEFCGDVVEVGEGVTGRFADAFVTASLSESCVTRRDAEPCAACRRDLPGHCLRRRVLGIRGADGAFADLILVPAQTAHVLPADLSGWSGAVVEPLAAAIRTFELSPLGTGDTVVVLGAGRLGLLVCRVAHSFGARVLAVSRSPNNRALALRFGAEESFDPADDADVRAVLERTEGLGADLVVECTGSPEGLAHALRLVRPRGTIALKSTPGRPITELDSTRIVTAEITLQGSRCGPFPQAIERLKSGRIPVEDYVAGVFPLEDIAAAFEAARTSAKILIEINP